jgi:signal transduction histidine kinase
MDEKTLKHIYEKFYQGDSSRQSDGNGLGLAIVKRVVTLCDGTIHVHSQPGQGTEFIVTLPVLKEEN